MFFCFNYCESRCHEHVHVVVICFQFFGAHAQEWNCWGTGQLCDALTQGHRRVPHSDTVFCIPTSTGATILARGPAHPPRLKAWSLGRGLRGTCAFLSLPHSAKILPRKAVLVPTRPPLGDKHLELTRPALASPDTSCPSQGPQVSLWGVGLESTQLWGDLVGQVAWAQMLPLGGWLRQRPPGLGAQGGSSVHGFILGKPWSYPELLSL